MSESILIVNTRIDKHQKSDQYLIRILNQLDPKVDISSVHFEALDEQGLEQMNPSKIILGGQNTPFDCYPKDILERFFYLIKNINLPLLGICGGHQLLSLCYGGSVGPIRVLNGTLSNYEGCWREKGFVPILKQTLNDPMLKLIPSHMMVYEDHCDEIKQIPDVFRVLCKGEACRIQAMKHWRKPIYGVQFHPERFSHLHTEGKQLLLNFLAL